MLDVSEYSSADINSRKIKNRSINKRRFSDEQIRSLETTFETETKLEPTRKAQLAKELGLQPRQVAIWFQNKRARWKSKLIEGDYNILLANYNSLASQFEVLKKQNQSLLIQLQKLKNEMAGKSGKGKQTEIQETGDENNNNNNNNSDVESDYRNIDFATKELTLSDDDSGIIKAELMYHQQNDHDYLLMEPAGNGDSSLTSSDQDNWGGLDSGDLLNQPSDRNCDQWWDFWT